MQQSYDVLIVGGGVVGSAIAYFLASNASFQGSVAVVERDPSYRESSTALSAASIRQQFSTAENIEISKFGTHFLRSVAEYLSVDDDPPELGFVEGGYLFLATDPGLDTLKHNHGIQQRHGVDVALLSPDALSKRFPWLNVEDLAAGSLGLSGEGWFDAYMLMQAFRRKARSLGVTYVHDEAHRMTRAGSKVTDVNLASGQLLRCDTVINAAGARADLVAAMAGIDLPVRSRKRCVFVFDCRDPIPNCPLLVDPSGVYVRPEGKTYICGVSPSKDNDPNTRDFDVDYGLFDAHIWPTLAHRIPAFEAIKLIRGWAGHYAYNVLDQNAIIGRHPEVRNFVFANGFSGHGLQQAPAVGRAVSELVIHGSFQTLDLWRFGFERLAAGDRVTELNVV